MPRISRDSLITFCFCLFLGGYVIYACQGFPQPADSQGFGQGPGFYPQVLGWSLLALGLLTLLGGKAGGGQPAGEESSDPDCQPARARYGLVAVVLLLAVADIFIMRYLGFFAAGFFLVLAMVLFIRPPCDLKTVLLDLVYSVGIVLLVYVVFEVFIKIQLPAGELLD